MKSKIYLLIAILCFLNIKLLSQTAPKFTVQITDNTKKLDEIPIYNLYYLSRFISADNLTPEQQEIVYSHLFSQIGEQKVQNFIQTGNDSSKVKYFLHDYLEKSPHYKNFKEQIETLPVNIYKQTDYYKNIKLQKTLISGYESIQKIGEELILYKSEIEKLKKDMNSRVNDEIRLENDKKMSPTDSIANSIEKVAEYNAQLLNIKNEIVEYQTSIKRLEHQYLEKEKQYINEIDHLRKQYFILYPRYNRIINQKSDFQPSKEGAKNIININSIVQSAQKDSSSGLNIPSESEFIIAVATVLADRAKQETAIWFMDQVRSRLSNPLIYDAFPETIKLISRLEDYKVPNFSAEWRFAIAKDFVEMPKNIVSSTWVKNIVDTNNIKNLKSGISFGYDLNRVMTERYNYKDIIRYFYINPMKESSNIDSIINNNMTRLYIITNELFAIDTTAEGNPHHRLLSFEELQSLTDDQWKILFELISLKYKDKLLNDKEFISATKDLIKGRPETTKWISNILISLAQFDKIKNDYRSSTDTNNENISEQNFYTTWQLIDQIINQLDNHTSQNKQHTELKKYLKDLISLYGDLQSKNFSSAIKKTFDLIDEKKPSNSITVNKIKLNNNVVLKETSTGSTYKLTLSRDNEIVEVESENNLIKIYNRSGEFYHIKNIEEIAPAFKFLTLKNDNFDFIDEMIAENGKEKYKKTFKSFSSALRLTEIQMFQLLHYFYLHNDTIIKNSQERIKNSLKNFDNIEIDDHSLETPIEKYNKRYASQLIKLTSFFGVILSVKNDKELANVIDSHALPSTSYKLKRKMKSSVDLNAYVGAFGGFMIPSKNSSYSHRVVGGITAPIGVAVTSSKKLWFLKNTGVTFDAVDLGNIVNHYLVSNTDYSKEVHFSEIFSPGITLLAGITNSPFVVSAGVKFLPLKTTFINGNPINDRVFDATIFHLGIKIDIPLVNFRSVDK
ncbi:hypothetical protein [Chryseobacterium sp. FH1]|uniref:hypothetical protein n=1 Tax=Chryseobacterium sp. FH1 TaxID=1233951 RepID=UPI0004E395A8|nr:hypothetical protein [Chryseobacterium sp. FH1]KFC19679.1 hypothetical protein IO90_10425 [Chryseobacterium sp. FH1]